MLKRISIRLRLTIMSILLLSICCVGLTIILNISANQMADVIEAMPITPSKSVEEESTEAAKTPDAMMAPMLPSTSSQYARKVFLKQSFLYMILVVIAGGGFTYLLSGKALKPLKELSVQMKNRTVHNLSEDLEIPISNDEIADLTCAFNEMSHKLDAAFAMQKRFSESAAHELRTPLSVLKTKVDVFKKKEDHTSREYDKLLDVISAHTNRLSDLVKDLLNFTNMDDLVLNENIEIKDLLSDIVEELSLLAEDKNIHLLLSGNERIIQGNKTLLHRAFYNVVENAIKYNKENGSVDIIISGEKEYTIVSVIDNGIGIPKEAHDLIFEPFYRIDKSRSRAMGGAGLGLALTKNIIEKHQGEISVLENNDGGSRFIIKL